SAAVLKPGEQVRRGPFTSVSQKRWSITLLRRYASSLMRWTTARSTLPSVRATVRGSPGAGGGEGIAGGGGAWGAVEGAGRVASAALQAVSESARNAPRVRVGGAMGAEARICPRRPQPRPGRPGR